MQTRDVYFFTDSSGFGGAEKALLALIRGLDRERWTPSLVFHPTAALEPLLEGATSASCELIPVPVMPDGLVGARRAVTFARLLRRRRPDVFHAHLTWPLACKFGLGAAIVGRIPTVATYHLVPPFTLTRGARFQQRLLGFGVDRRIAVSDEVASRLETLLGWPREKITVVHNGVSAAAYDLPPDAELRARMLQGHRAVLLVPARLDPLKGHEFLLEAARGLPGVHVVLAGDGPERTRLEALADDLGLASRVTFLGFREDVPQLLAAADVVVLPSVVEGLPLVVLEALAAGTPLVATAIGGTTEVVVDGVTGLLVPPRDPAALAAAVERVLADPAGARRRAEAGKALVAGQFTTERTTASVESVYDELLTGRRRRGNA